MTTTPDHAPVDAVVIGAGIAGLYQLYRLRELGLSTRVFEVGAGPGGTWYWNRYPGARCDIASLDYSYSFSPELEQEWTWTEKYPAQEEILRYIEHVADRFDLRRHITFETRVTSAAYDGSRQRWTVTTDGGEVVDAQFLITAVGCLSASKLPEIPGIDTFAGASYHTSRWPHEGVDFTGKRIGVIGTGSSGIQAIPIIAQQAAELTVFQRTPVFSLAARNRPLTETEIGDMRARYQDYRREARVAGFGVPHHHPPTQSALEVDEEERNRTYEDAWGKGTINDFFGTYTDLIFNREANDTAAEFVRSKIRTMVEDPVTAERLSPRSFPIGTKRPCLDTNYYETYNLDHVHLVDLRATPLVEVTERGIRTSEEEYELDAIVYATGFDAFTGALAAIDIRGEGGVALRDAWAHGPRAYLGVAVSGFPNMFTVTGPLSPSVFCNMMVSIEQHVEWVTDCIRYLRDHGLATIEADEQAQAAWVDHVAEIGNATLFPLADSWFMGANVPGKPRGLMAYLGGMGRYRERCEAVASNGYEGFVLTPERVSEPTG